MRWTAAAAIFFYAGFTAAAADLFVDSVNGSDANAGTSKLAPIRSVTQAETDDASFDNIYFRAGLVYRGEGNQFFPAHDNKVYGSYVSNVTQANGLGRWERPHNLLASPNFERPSDWGVVSLNISNGWAQYEGTAFVALTQAVAGDVTGVSYFASVYVSENNGADPDGNGYLSSSGSSIVSSNVNFWPAGTNPSLGHHQINFLNTNAANDFRFVVGHTGGFNIQYGEVYMGVVNAGWWRLDTGGRTITGVTDPIQGALAEVSWVTDVIGTANTNGTESWFMEDGTDYLWVRCAGNVPPASQELIVSYAGAVENRAELRFTTRLRDFTPQGPNGWKSTSAGEMDHPNSLLMVNGTEIEPVSATVYNATTLPPQTYAVNTAAGEVILNISGNPNLQVVEIPQGTNAIFTNSGDNIRFENLRIVGGDDRQIYATGARSNIVVASCSIGHAWNTAIHFVAGADGATGHQVYDSYLGGATAGQSYGGGAVGIDADAVRLRRNLVLDWDFLGLQIRAQAVTVATGSIEDNAIGRIGVTSKGTELEGDEPVDNDGQGIELTGDDNLGANPKVIGVDVLRNVVWDNSGGALAIWRADRNRIAYNAVIASGTRKHYDPVWAGEGGMSAWKDSDNNQWHNNTLYNVSTGYQSGAEAGGYTNHNNLIHNNIIKEWQAYALNLTTGSGDSNDYNIFHDNGGSTLYESTSQGANDLEENPLLVSPSGFPPDSYTGALAWARDNLAVQVASGAINSGTNNAEMGGFDLLGLPILGTRDRGAFENQSIDDTPAAPTGPYLPPPMTWEDVVAGSPRYATPVYARADFDLTFDPGDGGEPVYSRLIPIDGAELIAYQLINLENGAAMKSIEKGTMEFYTVASATSIKSSSAQYLILYPVLDRSPQSLGLKWFRPNGAKRMAIRYDTDAGAPTILLRGSVIK